MPSSPGPNDYRRETFRFFYRGISLKPQDALGEGKSAFAINIRGYEDGTFEPRYGAPILTPSPLPDPIHSIFRLNDATPYGEVGAPSRRILGSGTGLYGGSPGTDTYSLIDPVAYSGNPLTAVAATPVNSPRPFLYIADADRMRKVNSSFNDYPLGIAQPVLPPTAQLAAPQNTFLNTIGTANWTSYGGETTPVAPTPAPTSQRVNTTITRILYDDGGTNGMCSFVLDSFENVTPGMTAEIGASIETAIFQDVLPAIASTTIAAILYDVGVAGLCTIQPTNSFSAGQIELPNPEQIRRRYNGLDGETAPPVTVTRTVDYPVNALVILGGVELVRILSIAIGPDGVQSFRCQTNATFAAGATIDGIASIRAFCQTAWIVGDTVTAQELDVTLTPTNTDDPFIGGVQAPIFGGSANWLLVGDRAVQPEDYIRFGIRVSQLGYVESVRLVLDLSPTGPAFLKDYYFYEWRASDLVTAIQATSEITTGLVADAQADAVRQAMVTNLYGAEYGQGSLAPVTQTVDMDTAVVADPGTGGGKGSARAGTPKSAPVTTGSGVARQLALGNDAWMTLECRVGDLIRVGTDTTLTLGAILNVLVSVQTRGVASAIDLSFSEIYLTGGYGPDVGQTLPPYVYRYSYRSTITGERSNPSPPMRAGVLPRRGRVELTGTPSEDPQCDVVDWWRFGGSLARWAYVTTTPNESDASPPTDNSATDDMADRQIGGGQKLWANRFQLWPTSDLPRSGTCNVAGTAVEWVSGDPFNGEWAADSLIIINGIATQLYTSPTSTSRLEVVDNCGSGTAVPFSLPSPTLLAQSLPSIWGGPVNDVWFNFACGDPSNPGLLYWTHGNDPDAASDANFLVVSSGSDPLMGGFFDEGVPYVWSTQRLYRIVPVFEDTRTPFRVVETACTRGLWNRWFFCLHPDGGCFFGAKDGIYYTRGGGPAKSLTDDDLRPLFPQEGTDALPIRNLNPIDWTATTQLRLAVIDQILYFDYVDTEGENHTLVYDPRGNAWTPDEYAVGVNVRVAEPGQDVHDHILGGMDGNLRQWDVNSLVDYDENGDQADINWAYWTPWPNTGDARAFKQWGDAILDFNAGGSINGVLVTPVVNNGNTALTQQTLGAGDTLRDTYIVEVGTGGDVGYGVYSRNFGMWIEGAVQACDTNRPIFYLWEPASLAKGTSVARRATDWEDLGYKGAKFVQGVVIRANTFGQTKQVEVQYDGPNSNPQTALTLDLVHDGEQQIAYPLASAGWTPFIAELVRLQGADDDEWILLDWRWVWEPAPELATQWETPYSSYSWNGFGAVGGGVVAYESTADVVWTIEYQDGPTESHTLASSSGAYRRIWQIAEAHKGKAVRFRWTSDEPFRLYKQDCAIRFQPWGVQGGWQTVNPFGGPNLVDGAGV